MLATAFVCILFVNSPEAEFWDEIQTKVFGVFPFAIHSHLTQPLTVSTVQLLYTVKKKRGKLERNHTPFPMV